MSPLGLQLGRLHARESSQTGELMAFRDTAQCPTIEARFIFHIGPFGGIPINFIFSSPRSSVQVPVVHCFTFRKPLFQRKEALRIKFRARWTLGCFPRASRRPPAFAPRPPPQRTTPARAATASSRWTWCRRTCWRAGCARAIAGAGPGAQASQEWAHSNGLAEHNGPPEPCWSLLSACFCGWLCARGYQPTAKPGLYERYGRITNCVKLNYVKF